jgi:hypothetical protein
MSEEKNNGGQLPAPKPDPKPREELLTLEQVALGADTVSVAGLKVRMGWATGQLMTQKAFDKALNAYLASATDGTEGGGE